MSTLKLSDAIFMGRHTIEKPERFSIDNCAIPMALNAVGIATGCHHLGSHALATVEKCSYKMFEKAWPWLMQDRHQCPWCSNEYRIRGSYLIFHVFDDHVMLGHATLEQMCDWIRSIEPAEPEPSAYERAIQASELYPRIPDTDTETTLHRGSTLDDITEMVAKAERNSR